MVIDPGLNDFFETDFDVRTGLPHKADGVTCVLKIEVIEMKNPDQSVRNEPDGSPLWQSAQEFALHPPARWTTYEVSSKDTNPTTFQRCQMLIHAVGNHSGDE